MSVMQFTERYVNIPLVTVTENVQNYIVTCLCLHIMKKTAFMFSTHVFRMRSSFTTPNNKKKMLFTSVSLMLEMFVTILFQFI